ncbi:hypothetical protein [Rhizobium sp. Root1220]|uniref:hypothetical protein n=1 Tax=Rhizobium sp. Root1220 TaxID=1736432 RepID=UPI0006FAEF90|nr:hypothetical protein [Rhizobium sp. Root1220]KQV84104.1 hypothetical protein ASC90_00850 [Rhizobium sp. Root1220]
MKAPNFALLLTLLLLPTFAVADTLLANDIRRDIIGRTIYLATPLGGELPLNYHISGQVDGSGEAIGLGKYFKPSDTGKWWIQSDQLCQKFRTWYKGAPMCFELESVGPGKIRWTRDNGETGMARIRE